MRTLSSSGSFSKRKLHRVSAKNSQQKEDLDTNIVVVPPWADEEEADAFLLEEPALPERDL